MKGWLYITEIAHAVADKPEGPYQFKDVALRGPGNDPAGRWDAFNTHNACCVKMPDESGRLRYFLYFIANTSKTGRDSDWMDHVMHQRIGVAVADSPDGPWERHPQPVCVPQAPLCHYVVNPGVTRLPGGRYLMVLKGRADDHGKLGPMLHGWALADKPTGPFIIQPSLLFPANISAEDPCVWMQDGRVYAAVKDWQGGLSGTPGISWVYGDFQADGSIAWKTPRQASISPRRIRWADGTQVNLDSLERPFILLDATGRPSHLFAAAAVKNPFAATTDKSTGKANAHLPFNLCLPLQPAD
jgi:hypothetical protein